MALSHNELKFDKLNTDFVVKSLVHFFSAFNCINTSTKNTKESNVRK
jgi:hypothetical protein